ncbi:hypothetical protein J6590_100611, partial [Homalodisca vitripennis]
MSTTFIGSRLFVVDIIFHGSDCVIIKDCGAKIHDSVEMKIMVGYRKTKLFQKDTLKVMLHIKKHFGDHGTKRSNGFQSLCDNSNTDAI